MDILTDDTALLLDYGKQHPICSSRNQVVTEKNIRSSRVFNNLDLVRLSTPRGNPLILMQFEIFPEMEWKR